MSSYFLKIEKVPPLFEITGRNGEILFKTRNKNCQRQPTTRFEEVRNITILKPPMLPFIQLTCVLQTHKNDSTLWVWIPTQQGSHHILIVSLASYAYMFEYDAFRGGLINHEEVKFTRI